MLFDSEKTQNQLNNWIGGRFQINSVKTTLNCKNRNITLPFDIPQGPLIVVQFGQDDDTMFGFQRAVRCDVSNQ